jgi:hypothetical protein
VECLCHLDADADAALGGAGLERTVSGQVWVARRPTAVAPSARGVMGITVPGRRGRGITPLRVSGLRAAGHKQREGHVNDRDHSGRGQPSAADRLWVAGLRARHGDLISRYVQRRTGSPAVAEQVCDAVFRRALQERDTVPGHALPWLIATARRYCAQAARPQPPARHAPLAAVIALRGA